MADVYNLDPLGNKLPELDAFIEQQDAKEDAIISVLHKAQE